MRNWRGVGDNRGLCMATSPLGPGEMSLRDFIEAVGFAETAHGAVSTTRE